MRKAYRDQFRILYDILHYLSDKEKPISQIVVGVNIEYTRLNGLLKKFEELGYLQKKTKPNGFIWATTSEGLSLMETIKKIALYKEGIPVNA